MRDRLELPRLSLEERDRRWATVRQEMRAQGFDCLLLCGFPGYWDFTVANARYLCPIGGNAEFNFFVFPLEGEPTCFVLMPTFVEYWKRSQEWVRDVRPRKGSLAESVVGRMKELGLGKKTIGLDGLEGPLDPDGWLPHSVYAKIRELVPEARFVNTNDMMERIRAIKSHEEIEMLEAAGRLGDLMLETCAQVAGLGSGSARFTPRCWRRCWPTAGKSRRSSCGRQTPVLCRTRSACRPRDRCSEGT